MIELSEYNELQSRRALLLESFYELTDIIKIPNKPTGMIWNVLFVTGWVIALGAVLTSCGIFTHKKRKNCKATFFAVFHEKIRKTFQDQRIDTFDTIQVGVNRVLQYTEEEPTVFLLLVPQGGMSVATELATLLVHCTLIAYGYPASQRHVAHLLVNGLEYTSQNDEWPFFDLLRRNLSHFGISAVFHFENLHPQTVKTFTLLISMTTAPYPESVVILLVDVQNHFTEHDKETLSPNDLGRRFLGEHFRPHFDERRLLDTINEIGSRCILINP